MSSNLALRWVAELEESSFFCFNFLSSFGFDVRDSPDSRSFDLSCVSCEPPIATRGVGTQGSDLLRSAECEPSARGFTSLILIQVPTSAGGKTVNQGIARPLDQ